MLLLRLGCRPLPFVAPLTASRTHTFKFAACWKSMTHVAVKALPLACCPLDPHLLLQAALLGLTWVDTTCHPQVVTTHPPTASMMALLAHTIVLLLTMTTVIHTTMGHLVIAVAHMHLICKTMGHLQAVMDTVQTDALQAVAVTLTAPVVARQTLASRVRLRQDRTWVDAGLLLLQRWHLQLLLLLQGELYLQALPSFWYCTQMAHIAQLRSSSTYHQVAKAVPQLVCSLGWQASQQLCLSCWDRWERRLHSLLKLVASLPQADITARLQQLAVPPCLSTVAILHRAVHRCSNPLHPHTLLLR